jgi:hypothetical protein
MQDESINKQVVLDTISELNAISFYEAQEDSKECYYEIRKAIEQLQPKIGHLIKWYETIERENCTIHDPHCKCSECDQEYDPYNASLFNYCPNCGAKIESEE